MAAKKSSAVLIDSRSSALLKTDTRTVCEDTSTLLIESQIRHAITYGGENVIFTKAEIAHIKAIGAEPGTALFVCLLVCVPKTKYYAKIGMKILGFKPISMITNDLNIRHASFIYPNETVKGSEATSFTNSSLCKKTDNNNTTGGTKLFAALLDQMLEQQKAAIAVNIHTLILRCRLRLAA